VLVRYFPRHLIEGELPVASFLDVILYSREQIDIENEAMGKEKVTGADRTPWGIISVKPQEVDYELPMNPITAMRNAMGEEYGGSGRVIIKKEYEESVDYWSKNAIIVG